MKFNKRISNRKYPPIKCKKKGCEIVFTPTSKKNVYCCRQHQIDQNNDWRDEKAAPGISLEKIYRNNERILKKLYEACKRLNMSLINLDYLEIECFNHNHYTNLSYNSNTGMHILWNYQYGLEGYDKTMKQFKIHFRKTI